MAQKKQVSFQGIYSCSGNSEMLAEAGWQGSESSWAAGRGSQHTQENQEVYLGVDFPLQGEGKRFEDKKTAHN